MSAVVCGTFQRDNGSCSICLDGFTRENKLAGHIAGEAEHIFHKKCLTNWTYYKKSCPICRSKLDVYSLLNWREKIVFQFRKIGAFVINVATILSAGFLIIHAIVKLASLIILFSALVLVHSASKFLLSKVSPTSIEGPS